MITAKRDIEAMRDRMNAPIIYNHKIKGYTYTQEFKLLDFAGEQLFLFYVLARGLAKNQNYLPLTAEYSRNIINDRIKQILPEEYAEISDNFLYVNSDYEKVDFSLLKRILESMSTRKKLLLYYLTKSQSLSKRSIEPIKMICYGTKWYLAAYCYNRKGIRLFSLSRIDRLEPLNESFEQKDLSKDVDKLINESFGIAKADKVKIAIIKFYEPSSYYVKNQIWHKDQQIKEYEEGGNKILELTLPYGMPEELIGKVLKYGATAEIISPKELREQWIWEIKNMISKFLKVLSD
ncbi:MAG: WYL domain-containing protein [Melioribacteraceae bacterium]|nr:WYL domain-containing protein [Melioribacteraceae bacterium]